MDTNTTCGVYPVTTMSPLVCSGQGTCAYSAAYNRAICTCNAGWFGNSDFKVTTSQTDCHLSTDILRAFWTIYLVIHLAMGILLFVPRLLNMRDAHKMKFGANSYFCFSRKTGIFTISSYLILGYPAQLIYAIIKLAQPEENLGSSIALTIFYSIWRLTFYISSALFYTSLLESILKAQRKFAHVLQRAHVLSTIYTVVMCLVTAVPFIPLIANVDPFDPLLGMVPVAVFLSICALAMVYFASISHYVRSHILGSEMFHRLASVAASEQSEQQRSQSQLLLKFANLMARSRNVALSQAVLYAVFGAVPYLWNKHDYLLPFTWIPVLLIAFSILASLQTDSDERAKQQQQVGNSGNNTQEQLREQQQQAARAAQPQTRRKEKIESTVFQSVDVQSAVNVDVDSPELFAMNQKWTNLKAKSDLNT